MNLNKILSIFASNGSNVLRKEDLTDSSKKNDPAVRTIFNYFDSNFDGNFDSSEQALIDKFASLDGNNNEISIADLNSFSALSGSVSDFSFSDLTVLKSGKYSVENNTINTLGITNNKTSSTTFNSDGSVTTTSYSFNNTKTVIEYTSDYKLKSKSVIKTDGSQEQYTYDNAGILSQKLEIAKDGSQTTRLYNEKGSVINISKKDVNNNFISNEEYDYDDKGRKTLIVGYDSNGNIIARTLYNTDGTKVQTKYDTNGEVIQSDTFNNISRPLSSLVKNSDGTSVSTAYEYQKNGDVKTIIANLDSNGVKQSEQITIKHRNGAKEIYNDEVLVQKDEVNPDSSVNSTIYSAKDIISSVTKKDSSGKITAVDYYTYVNGKISTITEKDAAGAVLSTGVYNYDNPQQLKSLDHFDATGKLLDKAIWHIDGTKTKYAYSNGQTEPYSTQVYDNKDRIINSILKESDGTVETSLYAYDTPASGDFTVNTTVNTGSSSNVIISIIHADGSGEIKTYNADKTQLLQNDSVDKNGIKVTTIYENNKITSITTTTRNDVVKSKDTYTYTNGILSSVSHYNISGKTTGITQYDANGNTKDYDSLNRLVASKTTNKNTGEITTESYQYLSNGDKILKTVITLNETLKSYKTQTIHPDNSLEISFYNENSVITQKDQIAGDGKIKSTIYDTAKNRISGVVNKDANGNILLKNLYNYTENGVLDHIDCYDANNKLTQTIKTAFDGSKIITIYDSAGNVKSVTSYDKDGNVV